LISILTQLYHEKVIVFFKTKKQCHRVAIILGLLGMQACELHGNLSQTQRIQAFLDFKEGKFNFMLATDLAARGLDIK
jgi:ATP-dependent RNA helicase DDX27